MLNLEWLQAFLPLGLVADNGAWTPSGAGVLLHRPPLVWLVTAAHVVPDEGKRFAALVPTTADGRELVDLHSILKQFKLHWIFDRESDLAATLMPLGENMRVKAIPDAFCLDSAQILPSMQSYTVGCPYGFLGFDPQKAAPLVQAGIIAGVDIGKARVLTTAPTFPGNSGGPLVVIRSPISPGGSITVGAPVVLLGGIVLQLAQIGAYPSSVLSGSNAGHPPLHLGIAVGMEKVKQLLAGEDARTLTGVATSAQIDSKGARSS
jgi:hypothetical protein